MRDHDTDDEFQPSKTQVKKAMLALQDLALALLDLSEERLRQLPLDDRLLEALEELRQTHAHSARKRQMKYVGKLLRDTAVDEVQEALAAARTGQVADTARFHTLEAWRDRLLNDDTALAAWIAEHPQSDNRAFRNLVERARREYDATDGGRQGQLPRKGSAYRELFKQLRSA